MLSVDPSVTMSEERSERVLGIPRRHRGMRKACDGMVDSGRLGVVAELVSRYFCVGGEVTGVSDSFYDTTNVS